MMRHVLGVSYLGKHYHGWQIQVDQPSVQEKLEYAISQVAQSTTSVRCAGRTDRGVHASQQIIHFDANVPRSSDNWVRGTNAYLPADIRVLWHQEVADDFHARFMAYKRRYCYLIKHDTQNDPLWADNAWILRHSLDIAAIESACDYLNGTHDFSSFRSSQCQAKSPIKTMSTPELLSHQKWLSIRFEANAFLHHMIRILVHALVLIGRHKHPPQWMETLLKDKNRQLIDNMAPSVGLYFEGALYPSCYQLPYFSNAIGVEGL